MQLHENQSVLEFLEDWQGVLDEAVLAQLDIPPAQQVTMLLATLPPTWRPFVTTQGNDPNLSLPALINKIMQEDAIRNPRDETDTHTPGTAFAGGRGNSNPSNNSHRNASINSFGFQRGSGSRNNSRRRFSGRGRPQSLLNSPAGGPTYSSSQSDIKDPTLQLFSAIRILVPGISLLFNRDKFGARFFNLVL